MTRILRSKIFIRYILIGASFLLLCCIVLCGMIMYSTQKEYRDAQSDIATSRMQAALDDLNTQIELLSDIATDISTNYRFRKSYWQRGEYYQLELVTELKNYRNWSSFADEFALIYNESDYVFMSSGFKTYLDIYAADYWRTEPEWFRSRLERTFHQVLVERFDSEHLMLFIPVRTDGYNQSSGYATMIVICSTADVEERIRAISGIQGRLNLTYNSVLLIGEELEERHAVLCRRDSFVMRCSGEELYSEGLIPHLSPLMVALLALFTAAMIILFGYMNYRPIYGLASKYVENASDELTAIDNMLAALIHSGNESRKQIREIYARTRRTLVRSMLYGAVDNDIADTLHILDVSFRSQSYTAFAIGPVRPENDYDNLTEMIEDLSDSAIAFHAITVAEDGCIAVVVAMAEPDLQLDARDLLRSLLAEYSERLELIPGFCCEQPEEISGAYNEARESLIAKRSSANVPELMDELFDSILAGNSARAQEAAELWIGQVAGRSRRKYNEKSAVHDILVSLLENAERRNLKMTEPDLNLLVRAQNTDEFSAQMGAMIVGWCAERPAPERESSAGRGQGICDYIRENYSDPDLSLDMIAAEFDISVNTVCRMVKQHLGKTFREYLINLRLEEAKKRLMEPGATVADVCEGVGYSNLSYFIRSFKDYTGMTPSEYRRRTEI